MSTPSRYSEDEKSPPALRPEAFASVRAEIERMLTELHALGVGLKQNFEQSLSAVANAVEDQLKETISAAEQVVRKQTQLELRTKYGKEIELAMAETAMMDRRLQTANKEFDEQKRILATKLEEADDALGKLQADYRQTADQREELQEKLQQALLKLSTTEESLAEAQAEARQLIADKLEIETRLQQSEAKRIEAEQSAARLLMDTGQAEAGRKELETQLKESQERRSELEEAVVKLQAELKLTQTGALAAKGGVEARLKETAARLVETESTLARFRADFNHLQGENQRLESKLADAMANRSDAEVRLREAADRFARAEESIASLREDGNQTNTARAELEAKLKEITASRAELEEKLKETQSTRSQLETRLTAADTRRTVLELEIEKLKSELQTAKASIPAPAAKPETASGITAAGSGVKTVSSKLLEQEIVRVEGMLAEVTKLIDDPASALSTVMRKNVEKTEIEAYLKGIRFTIGQIEPK